MTVDVLFKIKFIADISYCYLSEETKYYWTAICLRPHKEILKHTHKTSRTLYVSKLNLKLNIPFFVCLRFNFDKWSILVVFLVRVL